MTIFEYSTIAKDYLALLIMLVIAVLLTMVILVFSYVLAKQNPDSEKLTAYECGFEPYEDSRHIYDVRFCVIAILFVIFDIEMLFLIPWCISISKLTLSIARCVSICFTPVVLVRKSLRWIVSSLTVPGLVARLN